MCSMKQGNGKRYTEEFKKQIVDLFNSGKSVITMASEYGLVEQTIYKWIARYEPVSTDDNGKTVTMKDYKDLQKKLAEVELENEILKKATAIFARKP